MRISFSVHSKRPVNKWIGQIRNFFLNFNVDVFLLMEWEKTPASGEKSSNIVPNLIERNHPLTPQ